jgi:hypothetical protein
MESVSFFMQKILYKSLNDKFFEILKTEDSEKLKILHRCIGCNYARFVKK